MQPSGCREAGGERGLLWDQHPPAREGTRGTRCHLAAVAPGDHSYTFLVQRMLSLSHKHLQEDTKPATLSPGCPQHSHPHPGTSQTGGRIQTLKNLNLWGPPCLSQTPFLLHPKPADSWEVPDDLIRTTTQCHTSPEAPGCNLTPPVTTGTKPALQGPYRFAPLGTV